jgi:hypothetical protein
MAMPNRGRRQRRSVVDAIADHGNRPILLLQRLDRIQLLFGQQTSAHVGDADFTPDPTGDLFVVAGQHNQLLNTEIEKFRHGFMHMRGAHCRPTRARLESCHSD